MSLTNYLQGLRYGGPELGTVQVGEHKAHEVGSPAAWDQFGVVDVRENLCGPDTRMREREGEGGD